MEEWRTLLPMAGQLILTIVALVWFFAKIDKKIALINQEMNLKFDEIGRDVKEIKDNHLTHLVEDLKELTCKLNQHLIDHGRQ